MDREVDISEHISQPVTEELLKRFNLVLVMESVHKEVLNAAFPKFRNKIFLLSEMVDKNSDVVDPYGMDLIDYQATADEIESYIEEGFKNIKRLAGDDPKF